MEKICFIIPSLKVGGGNRVFIELANELAQNGYNAEIIYPLNTSDKITFAISPKVTVRPVGKARKSLIGKLTNLVTLFFYLIKRQRNCKLIISDPFICIMFLPFPGKNLCRFIQGDDYGMFDDGFIIRSRFLRSLYKSLILLTYKKKIKLIFNSTFIYNRFVSLSKRKDVPPRIIHPGLNFSFRDTSTRDWESKINVCLVARKHPLKGFADFIKAWKEVKDKIIGKINAIYIISHDDLSGFWMDDFKLIKPDSDEEISAILNASHLSVSTSFSEGFGLPPLEAMACGCACIISNSGGVLEYASDRQNCLMYEPRNVEALKSLMIEAIQNKSLLKELGRRGRETAQRFSLEKEASAFLNVLYH